MKEFIVLVIFSIGLANCFVLKNKLLAPLSDELVEHINKLKTTWEAEKSKLHYWKLEAVQKLLGVPIEYFNRQKLLSTFVHDHDSTIYIPDHFDSRTKWPYCKSIQEINDQGYCGSCWAFGAVEAISDRICIKSKGKKIVRLSAEDLVECCRDCGNGCSGGSPESAWIYYQKKGVVTGGGFNTTDGCKPYNFPSCEHHINGSRMPCAGILYTPKCRPHCIDNNGISYKADKHKGKLVYTISNNETQIQLEIMKNGPVEVGFYVYADFLSYKKGVYKYTSGKLLGGHAVKMIGWGVENNVKYWLLANSWNEDWGEKGFFKMIRGQNECDIESGVTAGLPGDF